MRRSVWLAVCVLLFLTSLSATPRISSAPAFAHLNPGGPANLSEVVPVQVVFVGYEPAQVNQAAFLAALPTQYKPVVRSRLWYGVTELVGIHYTFSYSVTYTNAAFENAFFTALGNMAQPEFLVDGRTRTLFQDLYNAQTGNVLNVTDNYFIPAADVEKWLIDHAPGGVNTRRNTVFFINWWGRGDFRFHTYVKFGEPDPDTGYDFGVNRQSRKIIAWGGTTPDDEETGLGARGVRRIWFHDLSAGPESWTDNWNVDNADVDGDGVADYRLPPIWEYLTPGGYRPAAALTGDLAKVARYVAINLFFTPSPLYPPYITPNRLPVGINLDLNTYEGWRGVNASEQYQDPALLVAEVGEVHRIPYNFDLEDVLFAQDAQNCYTLWLNENRCYPARPDPPYPGFANLFLYNALNIASTWDGGAEYEAMFYNYATAENRAAGFLGFADDNWVDGTQSFTFNFISPGVLAAGYGLTTTQIHEYGHHFGMSHPHDGYDYQTATDYGPEGPYYFTWSGDEVNSMMSYVDLNWDYSQFDRDNANRFQAAAYYKIANAIAAQILASPNAAAAAANLANADTELGLAKAAMAAHDYVGAFDHARLAYIHVRTGAQNAGVSVVASSAGWSVLPPVHGGKNARKKTYSYQDKYGPGTHRSRR